MTKPTEAESPSRRVRALEIHLERELGAPDPDSRAEATRLGALEKELLETVAELAALDTDLADDRGHPVLADCSRWRDLAEESGAPEAAAEAEALATRILADHAAQWQAESGHATADGDPGACFRALADARALDLEALSLTRGGPPLADARADLRARFLRALEARPPPAAERDAWVRELLDRADVVLTSIDDVGPGRARALLDLVANDMEWHLRHAERGVSWRRRRLKRRIRRLRAEQQERDLQWRLEERFGKRPVTILERTVFWLIILVLALFTFEELRLDPSDPSDRNTMVWLGVIDTLACVVFLTEVAVKLAMVKGRRRWFYRHFFVDILPSIPFAALTLPATWDTLRLARVARFIRLARVARYLRILRPAMRIVRAFGFLTRGSDRVVRKYGHLLNRDIVLYPTREERASMERRAEGVGPRLRRLQARVRGRWEQALATARADDREVVASARVEALEGVRKSGALGRHRPLEDRTATAQREIPADRVLHRLAGITPEGVEAEMGQDFVARVARAVRIFSFAPVRWFPVFRRYVPRTSRGMSDSQVVVAAAHKSAAELQRHHGRWLWLADLDGTVTPAQFVDRVGSAMVKGSLRPAYRLLVFGLIVLLIDLLVPQGSLGFLEGLYQLLKKIVSDFVIVIGSICVGILGIGWWLRRMAGQATDFFTQSARAQYLALTESVKSRHLERDAAILDRRVFGPERLAQGNGEDGTAGSEAFADSVRRWLLEAQAGDSGAEGFSTVERVVMLYRDGLDGSLLTDSDTRTTAQLLGNFALRNLRVLSARFDARHSRTLARLDLERQKALFKGPYLWFSLLCQAVSHGVARLIVDYNRHVLPLRQLARAAPEERAKYEAWLEADQVADVPSERVLYFTTHFTALHFLDDDARRDTEVERVFGPTVLQRLRRDRRFLFRRVFGCYPLHRLPRDQRVLNLYRNYQRWFAGGRGLLVPLRAAEAALRFAVRFLRWLRRCVHEIRQPRFEVDAEAMEGATFHTALRKIHRMRGPVAEEALRLRLRFDPEYLGLRLPGMEQTGLEDCNADEDLRFLDADPSLGREVEEEQRRAAADMLRFGRLLWRGLFDDVAESLGIARADLGREHLRAAACAYLADLKQVRRHVSAKEILRETYEQAAREDVLTRSVWPRPRLYAAFRRYWREHGLGDAEARRAAWRATVRDVDGVAGALLVWHRAGDDALLQGKRIFADLLRHPQRITEKLVTLRAVQTLSLVDLLNYREHIYRLGDYAASGDRPGESLTLQ
ncbi:MAG: hypothetical protein ACYS0K_10305 [Planctomycetota bacterium]|jgi:hypothetical protein